MPKLVLITAPSGTGKSTVISRLTEEHPELGLEFSISATSRPPRGSEVHGREYYFFSPEEFRSHIAKGEFLEYEEVYPDRFYGTLRSEVERITLNGKSVIFDLDYIGALNIKKLYTVEALAIFIMPPSLGELRRRLELRGTDSPKIISERLAKAETEMSRISDFDLVVTNDDLEQCLRSVYVAIRDFLSN